MRSPSTARYWKYLEEEEEWDQYFKSSTSNDDVSNNAVSNGRHQQEFSLGGSAWHRGSIRNSLSGFTCIGVSEIFFIGKLSQDNYSPFLMLPILIDIAHCFDSAKRT